MVKIIAEETRKNSKNEEFNVFILQGSMELVKSQDTGKFYATARKCSITSTFDRDTALELIGTKLPGTIEKSPCDPYTYQTESGEEITLDFQWVFNPSPNTMEEAVMGDHVLA